MTLRCLLNFSSRVLTQCLRAWLVLALAFTASHASAQNTAQGTIAVDGKKTEFRYAYASKVPSRRTGKLETFLILTDKPLSAKAISNETERGSVVEKEGIGLIEIKLDETKDVVSTYFDVASLKGDVMSRSLKLSFDSFTDKVLQGRFYSEREDRAFKHSTRLTSVSIPRS